MSRIDAKGAGPWPVPSLAHLLTFCRAVLPPASSDQVRESPEMQIMRVAVHTELLIEVTWSLNSGSGGRDNIL